MSCCSSHPTPTPPKSQETHGCCGGVENKGGSHDDSGGGGCCGGKKSRIDYLMFGSLLLVIVGYVGHLFLSDYLPAEAVEFCSGVYELFNKMWWGLALGVLAVGVLAKVPREWVAAVLGKPGSVSGIFRAMAAGLILDLCNHGILLIAMKLYERGASYGQTLTFLIASPWNSFSLTLILLSLIGVKWTLLFILLSSVLAVVTGLIVESMVRMGKLAPNANQVELPSDFKLGRAVAERCKSTQWSLGLILTTLKRGLLDSGMIIRWILFGTVLAAGIRALVPIDFFGEWFGPAWTGVLLTLAAATVIEVCSEGSSPIAADLVTRAAAPGNGFAFLMAGAATDYTEIMALKETTKSWKMALLLPLLTLPQVVIVALMLNSLGG